MTFRFYDFSIIILPRVPPQCISQCLAERPQAKTDIESGLHVSLFIAHTPHRVFRQLLVSLVKLAIIMSGTLLYQNTLGLLLFVKRA